MIGYGEFAEWAKAQGLSPERCTRIEIVPAAMVGKREATVWLRAVQIVEDADGQFVVDTTKTPPEALEEVLAVPMVSLP